MSVDTIISDSGAESFCSSSGDCCPEGLTLFTKSHLAPPLGGLLSILYILLSRLLVSGYDVLNSLIVEIGEVSYYLASVSYTRVALSNLSILSIACQADVL